MADKLIDDYRNAIKAERAWFLLAFQCAKAVLDGRLDDDFSRKAAMRSIDSRIRAICEVYPEFSSGGGGDV